MRCTATAAAKKPNAPQADGGEGVCGGGRGGAYNQSLCVRECVGEAYCVDVFLRVCVMRHLKQELRSTCALARPPPTAPHV